MMLQPYEHTLRSFEVQNGAIYAQGQDRIRLRRLITKHLGKEANIGTPDGIIKRIINESTVNRKGRPPLLRIRLHIPWVRTLEAGTTIRIDVGDVSWIDYEIKNAGHGLI
jgi:hypothetical protein